MTRRVDDSERRNADLFLADLLGRGGRLPVEDQGEGSEPDGGPGAGTSGREPFFGDERGESWRVIARPGARARGLNLRDGDLIVRRMATEGGGRGWQCLLHEDVDAETLRGPDGRLRDDTLVLRRVSRRWRAFAPRANGEANDEAFGEIVEVCGFFGPNNVQCTEQQVRDGVATRAVAEWTAWHASTGAPRLERDDGMFGRLFGFYLAASGATAPDTLTAMQATALDIHYGPFLTAGAASGAAAGQAALIRNQLLAGAPGATVTGLAARVDAALGQAREAHDGTGASSAWSAAFVTACVRGATIAQGLEAIIGTAASRQHVGRDQLLLATLAHATYTIEARRRRAATRPPQRGTYHAFRPDERAPQRGDIIVQDRREHITAAQVVTLAALSGGITHGDIVIEVQPGSVVTIGGNVSDSVRKRRYPRDASGMLTVDRQQLFAQETDAGTLPALPLPSTQNLDGHSTARIFALLAPVEDCVAVPGQPYGGGVLV